MSSEVFEVDIDGLEKDTITPKTAKPIKKRKASKAPISKDGKRKKVYDIRNCEDYILSATTVCGIIIKQAMQVIAPLTHDAILRFSSENGVTIFAMEHIQMALVTVSFNKEMFYPFECKQDFEIAINTNYFLRILQQVSKYDSLSFFVPNSKELTLEIIMVNVRKGIYSNTPIIASDLIDTPNISMPPIRLNGLLEIPAVDFQQIIHELFQTASVVTFATNRKMITKNTSNGSCPFPRNHVFYPSEEGGIKFLKDADPCLGDNSPPFTIDQEFNEEQENSKKAEESNVVTDQEVYTDMITLDPNQSSDSEDESETRDLVRNRIHSAILERNQKLGDDFIQSDFMLKYINSFAKATPMAKIVRFMFVDNGPLITHYVLEYGLLTFCLSNVPIETTE